MRCTPSPSTTTLPKGSGVKPLLRVIREMLYFEQLPTGFEGYVASMKWWPI